MGVLVCRRLKFDRVWPAIRDVASWGLGAWWGDSIIRGTQPGDPWKIQLVAMLLGLPFVFRADELRRAKHDRDEVDLRQSSNGHQESDPERLEP